MTVFPPENDSSPFVWVFDPRFDELLEHYRRYLSGKEGRDAVPIVVRGFPTDKDEGAQVYVLGEHGREEGIRQQDPEDVNRMLAKIANENRVCVSDASKKLWQDIAVARSGAKIPLIAFTTQFLPRSPFFDILGPNPDLVFEIDSKARQFEVFKDLGVPLPEHRVGKNFEDVKNGLDSDLAALGSFVLLPEKSAGGYKARLIASAEDLGACEAFLQEVAPGDLDMGFLLSRYIRPVCVPSCNALIDGRGNFLNVGITELLFSGFCFDGFIHPVFLRNEIQKRIVRITRRIGRHLADSGFRGCFAADFLLDQDENLYFTEINPRFSCEHLYFFSVMEQNLFAVLAGDHSGPPLIPEPPGRVVISKIRPVEKRFYSQELRSKNTLRAFLNRETDEFREYYWKGAMKIRSGSFLGLFGKRLDMGADRETLIRFYMAGRREEPR